MPRPGISFFPRITSVIAMTGQYETEVSDASGTLLLDVVNRTWSDKLLGLLEIDKALLPGLHESQEVSATLSKEGAAALGLNPGVPVVGGGGDQAAGRGRQRNRHGRRRQSRLLWHQRRCFRPTGDQLRSRPAGGRFTPCVTPSRANAVHLRLHAFGLAEASQWLRNQLGRK